VRSPIGRIALVVGTIVALVVLFVVLRPGDDDEAAATTTAGETTTTTAPTTTAEPPPPGPRRIPVIVRGGQVVGGVETVRVEQGEQVVLVVRADVSDHVHLHGYDRTADVGPGAPAQIAFRATIPGRFEVELEDRKLRILELEVRP
jgi:hypothetical protein